MCCLIHNSNQYTKTPWFNGFRVERIWNVQAHASTAQEQNTYVNNAHSHVWNGKCWFAMTMFQLVIIIIQASLPALLLSSLLLLLYFGKSQSGPPGFRKKPKDQPRSKTTLGESGQDRGHQPSTERWRRRTAPPGRPCASISTQYQGCKLRVV